MNNGKIIGYIQDGIVIDHIPLGKIWQIVHILGIDKLNSGRISIGEGYESKKLEKKGLLKVEGMTLSMQQLNYVALVAEGINVSFIEKGNIVNKVRVKIPSQLEGFVSCSNEGCISRDVYQKVSPVINYDSLTEKFVCHYCNKSFGKDKLELLF